MKKFKLFILYSFLLLFSGFASAQTTAVQGTIVDSDGTTWFNAKVTLNWVPNSNYPNANQYTYQGQPLTNSSALLKQTVIANNVGVFNLTAIDSNQIQPAGSTYQFIIQSYTSAQSSVLPNLALTGASQNVSSFIATNIIAPRFAATAGQYGGAFGYGTNEVSVTPVPGGSFFNVTAGVIDVWACSASGCSWQTQAVGSFCSTSSCTIQNLSTLNFNNTCEASTQAGSDFITQIDNCAAQSYMTTGGIITAWGYGNSTQTSTVAQLTALSNKTQPILLELNPATRFIFNGAFSSTLVNSNIASFTSGVSGACMVPIANGSAITAEGNTYVNGRFTLGNSAYTYDFVCNANQDATQQTFDLEHLTIQGNGFATMKGSLLHAVQVYDGTYLNNVQTSLPYGNSVTLTGGGQYKIENSNFTDEYPATGSPGGLQYPGAVLTLNCVSDLLMDSGSVQGNGPYNPLLVGNNCLGDGRTPTTGSGYANQAITFQNVYVELLPAQVGSFTGHATNVDPIQILDPAAWTFDQLYILGNINTTYQTNVIDLTSSGANIGQYTGPFNVRTMTVANSLWAGKCLVNNTINNSSEIVAPSLRCWKGSQSGAQLGGSYSWSGSGGASSSYNFYIDYQNVASETDNLLNVVPTIVANLLPCTSSTEGQVQPITDSTTKVWGTTVTGGGTLHVKAYCNGSTWTVDAGTSTVLSQGITICASGCTFNTSICTTSGLAWNSGACNVNSSGFTWPIAFADTNYAITCSAIGVTGSGANAVFAYIPNPSNKSNTLFYVYLESPTAVAVSATEVDCIGVHN